MNRGAVLVKLMMKKIIWTPFFLFSLVVLRCSPSKANSGLININQGLLFIGPIRVGLWAIIWVTSKNRKMLFSSTEYLN